MNTLKGGPASLALLVLVLVLAAAPAAARQDPLKPAAPDPKAKASVSSTVEFSFLVPLNHDVLDPVGLARFQVSLETLLHGTVDDSIRGSGPLVKGAFFAAVLMLDRTIAKMGHEYGHIAVFNRAGYNDFLLSVGQQQPEALTFREVFINSLVPQRHMAVQLEEDDAQDAMMRFQGRDFEEFTALSFAGGLNQEQVHLNLFRERVLRHQFGFFDTSSYFIESVSTLAYTGSDNADIDGYVNSLARAGFTSSVGKVKAASLVRFLSGSAVSAGIGFYRAMSEDAFDGFAPRVILKGQNWTVLWPEFESFLTLRGPSVRASLPVRAAGALVIPGLEISMAEEGSELEAGVEASRPATSWLDLRTSLYAGTEGGYWAEIGVGVKPDPALSILLSWHAANGYTFHRDVYGETLEFEESFESGFKLGLSAMLKF
ncbi:MAG TPA: hypothetical protein VJU16_03300 [Planctomycetota bacterium]|nr:hypothetical protein [Planctomycetota bacterium]